MVDPVLIGLAVGLIQKAAEIGMERFFADSCGPVAPMIAAPIPKPVIRRRDYSDGYGAISDANISVAHHLAGVRKAPTFLILEKFNRSGDGFVVPMLQGETAFLTLARDHYSIAALIVDLPRIRGGKPTLRGLGWADEFIASDNATVLRIPTKHPTIKLVQSVGLSGSDGTVPFLLPPPPVAKALPAGPALGTGRRTPAAAPGIPFVLPAATGRIRCDVCAAKFPTFAALADHERWAHPSGGQCVVDWFDDL
ncbi:hypothetical protein KHQ06_31660 [Nocardia tengchongensis]|uniref:C2H2-type domain-containing protein n=1 Tax=Nocardia tengchongensis TaxID=2055889 RepID=A0ABX8CNV4_9NOCA|nr:hypothetical protein [Nocardia tengchongensis]QVI20633.1 hypothetical protein KHQ06_31660 [Nocardia tengchongensis]